MAFDWKALVRTVAPGIATALGGPLAGMATSAVSNALLGKPDGTEEEIAAAAAMAGPDALLKLKQEQNNFTLKLKELGIRSEEIAAGDRDSARKRETATGDHTARNLAYIAIIGFFLVLLIELVIAISPDWVIDETTQRTLDVTTGVLFAWVLAVKDYYFGSSIGDVHKDRTIRSIAESE